MNQPEQIILLIDDDEDDLQMLKEAFATIKAPCSIMEARSGFEALVKLRVLAASSQLPSLIVLDINMPRMNGKETLLKIKSDKELSTIPVIMFTTSSNEKEKLFFANYKVEMITKPQGYEMLCKTAKTMFEYCKPRAMA